MKETKKEKIPSRAITLIAFLLLLLARLPSTISFVCCHFYSKEGELAEGQPNKQEASEKSPFSYPKTRGANNAEVDDDSYVCGYNS